MKRFVCFLVFVFICLPQFSFAQQPSDSTALNFTTSRNSANVGSWDDQPTRAPAPQPTSPPVNQPLTQQQLAELHYLGGILGLFFHELGHCLIDAFQLPITGREENVVDEFSTLLILEARKEGLNQAHYLILGFADFFYLLAKNAGQVPWGDEHPDNMVRFGNILCFLYGSSPAEFQQLADHFKLPKRRQHMCCREYKEKITAWERLVEPHTKEAGATGPGKVRVRYDQAGSAFGRKMRAAFVQNRLFDTIAQVLTKEFALPYDITIVLKDCGTANCWWDPGKREIVLCYEMMKFYADMLTKRTQGQTPQPNRTPQPTPQRAPQPVPQPQPIPQPMPVPQPMPQPQKSMDGRVIGQWMARINHGVVTYAIYTMMGPQGQYYSKVETWRQDGVMVDFYEETGSYQAINGGLVIKVIRNTQGPQNLQGRFPYMLQNNNLTIKGLPIVNGYPVSFMRIR